MLKRFINFRINIGDLTSQKTFRMFVDPEFVLINDAEDLKKHIWDNFSGLMHLLAEDLEFDVAIKYLDYYFVISLEGKEAWRKKINYPESFFYIDSREDISVENTAVILDEYWSNLEFVSNLIELTDLTLVFEQVAARI